MENIVNIKSSIKIKGKLTLIDLELPLVIIIL